MGINTLIPVQIAFHIDNIADLQVLDSCVYIGGIVAKIGLYNEGIGLAIQGNAEVQVVAVRTGAIPVVQVSNVISAFILAGCFNSHAFECNILILVVDQFIGSEHCGNILDGSKVGITFHDFKGSISDFHFTGPFRLISGNFDFGSGYQFS